MRKLSSLCIAAVAAAFILSIVESCGPAEVPVSSVSLNQSSLSLEIGATANLTATVNPSDATDKTVVWSSSNPSVATVSSGTVTAVAEGSAMITATAGGKTGTCQVTVKAEEKVLVVGNAATVPVEGATVEVDVKYNVEYSVEVEASAKSWIHYIETKAVKTGKMVFKVDANDGEERSGKVTIKDKDGKVDPVSITFTQAKKIQVESVKLDKDSAEIEIGKTLQLTATVSPDNATDKTVIWSSDNEQAATVDEKGLVTGVAEGKATITAKAGEKSSTCVVDVTPDMETKARNILMDIYNSMDGPNWKKQDNWGTDAALGTWAGVEFDPNKGGVYSLRFDDFGLKGEFPESIGKLTSLQDFYVQNEPGVTGTLPDSFRKLVNLSSFDLYETSMTSLPDVFGDMKELGYVFIYANHQMGGPLPESIGLSDNLYTFLIQDNVFTGSVPASWAEKMDLQGANLRFNHLSGAIPKTFLQGDKEQVGWRLSNILQQQEEYGFDIGDIDIPGCWPKGAITDFDGKTFTFADVVGKNEYTVYLNWATWCPYSSVLMPQLKAYYDLYRQDGLEFIATVWHPEGHDFSESERELEQKTILEKGYDQWYNFFYGPLVGTINICHLVPTAEVYDRNGNVLFSSVLFMPDPVRNRYGTHEGEKSAYDDLIPFLETVLGPADPSGDYESTDFSKDGQVLTLQKASVGKGINIVFMGDGYTDKDMGNGGLYEKLMKEAMDEFFAIEPYKTFRNRFNVYAVKVVSKNGRIGEGYSTALGTTFANGTEVIGDLNKCYEYALKVPEITSTENLLIPVMVNTRRNAGTARMSDTLQSSVAFFASFGNLAESFGGILRHEAGGHGFAFLADEYSSYDTTVPKEIIADYQQKFEKYGWYANVDFTSDPEKVHWSAFLSDDRYKDEVGIFEGGALYSKGVWRPTQNSMMNEDAEYFNAPSRWAIYQRIMKLSGEECSFEKFLEYDKVNRGAGKASSARGF